MRDQIVDVDFDDRDGVLVAVLAGEVDGSNASELRLAISERLSSDASALVLDISGVTYLDSSGVHLLFDLGRLLATRRQAVRLVVPDGAPTRRVLELCDIGAVAPMDGTVAGALREIETATDVS